MNRLLCGVLAAGCVAVAGAAGQPPAATTKAPEPTVEQLIEDLGHPVFAVRERATRELWKRGAAARPAVAAAARSADAEVARRARDLLDKFDWGLFPDTPAEVSRQIREFRSNDLERQKKAATELMRLGKPGTVALRAALPRAAPADLKAELAKHWSESPWQQLVRHVAREVRREVPRRLFEKKVEEADELVSLTPLVATPEAVVDFAAYRALRGTLPEAIAATGASLKAGGPGAELARLTLAHLYRAHGDFPKAREAAADFPRQQTGSTLVEMLLEEERNWAELAKRADASEFGSVNNPDALRLTFLRLAGRANDFDDAATSVLKSAQDFADRTEVRNAAHALLLSHKAKEATDLLLERRQNLGLLAELLIGQMRYKEALALVDGNKKARDALDPQEKVEFDLRRARLLATLGRRDEAVQLFGAVADALRLNPEGGTTLHDTGVAMRSLLRAEIRVGMRDLAAEHAAGFLTSDDRRFRDLVRYGESPFEILFDTDSDPAETLFWALRNKGIPGPQAGPTMRRVRELFTGTAPPAAVDEALKVLTPDAPAGRPAPRFSENDAPRSARQIAVGRHLARACILRAAKRMDEAEEAYAAAAKAALPRADADIEGEDDDEPDGARSWVYGTSTAFRPWVEYGEFLMDRGKYKDAAAKFEQGWLRFPDESLLLYLSGRALIKAGDTDEGKRRCELAHWVTLGNERARGKFLEELIRRGYAAGAKRETELLLKACWSRDGYFGNVMNQAARASVLNKDFRTAELCAQRSLLVLMKVPGVHFVEMSSYLGVPHNLFVFRARALLLEGKVDEAVARAKDCLKVVPGNSELVIGMVPELDRRGRAKEADELFGKVWAAYADVLKAHPESASSRNAAAWMAAHSRRELDTALAYAKKAVESDPKSVGYRETLAEVHFRRGDRDAALALMTTLAAENPKNRLFRRQLTRYQTADPSTPLPDTDD